MRLQIIDPSEHPNFLDLPWHRPLAEWTSARIVEIPHGIHRHEVRFVDYDGTAYVIKELPEDLARREVRLLRALEAKRVPAVDVVGAVVDRGPACIGEGALITRHLTFSLTLRLLLMDGRMPHLHERVLDALASMLVRNHLAGFFWGDCSLANALFRRDAGALNAYVVDVETGELHGTLSEGQRSTDLYIATQNLAGGLTDLAAAGTLAPEIDPIATALQVEGRYRSLWSEITDEESFSSGEGFRLDERIRRINELGFDVDEVELTHDATGDHVRLIPRVVEVGYHGPRLFELTGLRTQENQARRLLNDISRYRGELEHGLGIPVRESVAATRWYDELFAPTLAAIPLELRAKLQPAEVYHQVLEHRWVLSEKQGADVGMDDAIDSYVDTILAHVPDEVRVIDAT
jgi:Domain of unknown function (DUF4032)/Lipopolysaccharide kinase (Kdo/WaaP) family